MSRTVAIIQARMGASRLPNKMLLHLHGYPVIEWVWRRVSEADRLDEVVIALPEGERDEVLAEYLEALGAPVFRGSEHDLVDRFWQAAGRHDAGQIVRVCADNPLICASEIDRLVDFFREHPCDYAYNHIPDANSYPDGLGAEICSRELLDRINREAVDEGHREHLFNYVRDNAGVFSIATFEPPEPLRHPELKLDLDTMDDYRRLLARPYRIDMSAEQVVTTALN